MSGPDPRQPGRGAGEPLRPAAAHALVVSPDDWAIDDAASQLAACGRSVHRCSDTTGTPIPCNALVPGHGCPLEVGPVDAVPDVRSRAQADPTLAELGAICGLRSGVPLVIGGPSESASLGPWATAIALGGDAVATCDHAVRGTQDP
jgi:hypothetical protein